MIVLVWVPVIVALTVAAGFCWRPDTATGQWPIAVAVLLVLVAATILAAIGNQGWAVAVAGLAGLLGVATMLRRSTRARLMAAENGRLRALASERADRVSMLSHEVRTPLALVAGAAELLAEQSPGPLTPTQQQFVQTIVVNCERMVALSEHLLMEARIEAGIFRLHLEGVDVRSLFRRVVSELRLLHSATLLLDCPHAPRRVPADPALLRQVLINLVTNAARYGGDTVITVRITDGEDCVVVAVSDSGPGMSAAQRARLFTRTLPEGGGSGLGLIISRRIVELHGGKWFVDTVPHRGTTMIFTIPAAAHI